MTIDVRTIDEAEVEPWVAAMRVGFLDDPADLPLEVAFRRTHLELDHTWAGFDGSAVVGTLRSFATELTVPGGQVVPATALTHVTVLPTHRRQGLLTRMIEADLASCVERGDVVSVLVAAEYPIYGRFGYGPATEAVDLHVEASTRFTRPVDGSVELVDRHELRAAAPAVFDELRHRQPGAIQRDGWWWDIVLGILVLPGRYPGARFFALGRDAAGEIDGALAYRVDGRWDAGRPAATLTIDDLIGRDADAIARLWHYCLSVDWVARVEAPEHGVADPLPWFVHDARTVTQHGRTDYLWARLLDTPRALAGRRYLVTGELVLEVIDPLGYAAGRVQFAGGPDGSGCEPSTRPADLTIGVSALSAAYLGGYRIAELAIAGQVVEHRPGSIALADAMFRSPVTPWAVTSF